MREREKDKERERKGKRPLKVDTFLSAPDLLARHLLVRRDSAVPETPTRQGTNGHHLISYMHPWCDSSVPCSSVILFYSSSNATLQRRCSHTQRSGPLQRDGPEAWGCDWFGEPLPLSVS